MLSFGAIQIKLIWIFTASEGKKREPTAFLLVSFLFVLVHSGSLWSFLVIGRVPPATLPFILRVRKLFVTGYPLICGADCNIMTSQTVSMRKWSCYSLLHETSHAGKWRAVLLDKRLSGSSVSSSTVSSGTASSGMACIWTPGAWGSIRRFSNSRCLNSHIHKADVFRLLWCKWNKLTINLTGVDCREASSAPGPV